MENRIKVFHFHNGRGGGVLSVLKNLIEYSRNPLVENHIIYTINKEVIPQFSVPEINGVSSTHIFYFSPKWNFWHTCKQLSKLIPDKNVILVAHDWLELGMASHLGLKNPVIQFVHGDYDYYYHLAASHKNIVNSFIAISAAIYKKLIQRFPERKSDIHFCRFPVPEVKCIFKTHSEALNIIYCVRNLNDENKQFHLLPKIDKLLRKRDISAHWTIIGSGKSGTQIDELFSHQVTYFPSLRNEQVHEKMCSEDVLILPSIHEGFPVVVVEAMKAGLVPLTTNWNGATQEIIIENKTGFYLPIGDAEQYAEKLSLLSRNREKLHKMSLEAKKRVEMFFNPYENARMIEDIILNSRSNKRDKKTLRVYGSRLDKKWIPNTLVCFLRNLR